MNPAVLTAPPPAKSAGVWPLPHKWTCDDLEQVGGLPSMRDQKVMLIGGEILELPPPSSLASISQLLLENWLRTIFPPDRYCVRCQLGLIFGIITNPVPDFAVVPGTPRTYSRHPRTALLIVEVADTSLAYDTGEKASVYAAAGIADYWVIDVNNRNLHVFRNPQPDAAQHYGHGFTHVRVLGSNDTVSSIASPGRSIAVSDLLS